MENEISELYNKNKVPNNVNLMKYITEYRTVVVGNMALPKPWSLRQSMPILLANSSLLNKLFIVYVLYFDSNLDNKKINHIAIDFEFNHGKIALMQINFGKVIWILDPKDIESNKLYILVNLLTSRYVYKIFHGGESLDLPYIYEYLLRSDKKLIIKFTKKYIDTRFLCEYYRKSIGENGRCSIYDALLYFKTINQSTYEELNKINKDSGPIYRIVWDVKKLDELNIKYAFYDVYYSIDLLMDIYKAITHFTPVNIRSYYYINEIMRFIMLERNNIINISGSRKEYVHRISNNIIEWHGRKISLSEMYKILSEKDFVFNTESNDKIDMNFLRDSDYVRKIFDVLIRYIVYAVYLKKYGDSRVTEPAIKDDSRSDIEKLYKDLEEVGLNKIRNLLGLFEDHIKNKIIV
jgi:hypothetical protein